jgi:hypothetical protein
MRKSDFIAVIAYLEAGCARQFPKQSMDVYFDLLGDLDATVFQAAARIVVLEHPWHTFPSIAELREAAATVSEGQLTRMTAAEAWETAWNAIKRIDPERKSSMEQYFDPLPPLVKRAIQSYGLCSLCFGKEAISIVRAQFMRIFDELSESQARRDLLPLALKENVQQIGEHPCEQVNAVAAMLPSIGCEPRAAK